MNIDKDILSLVLDNMPINQRREWLIKILMARHGTTFEAIAKKHRISKWYLCGSLSGRFYWNTKVNNALENHFNIDLSGVMTEEERKKLGR
jgi:hypothetical protein